MTPLTVFFQEFNNKLEGINNYFTKDVVQTNTEASFTSKPPSSLITAAACIGTLFLVYKRPYLTVSAVLIGMSIPVIKRACVYLKPKENTSFTLDQEVEKTISYIQNIWSNSQVREGFLAIMIPLIYLKRVTIVTFAVGLGYSIGSYAIKNKI